jgi:hypothetical protein
MRRKELRKTLMFRSIVMIVGLTCFGLYTHGAESALSGKEAQERMESARDEIAIVRSNIFLTLVELDRVRGERDAQHPQFQVFTNQLARMEDLAKAIRKRAEEMRGRGDAYFADWEARTALIPDPEVRKRAEERYTERKTSYDAINRFMQDARTSFLPFVQELTNIKTLLQGPLDPKSIASAKDLFMRANWHSIDTQRALMGMEEEFDNLATSFAKDK